MNPRRDIFLYCLLYTCVLLVNKHVLSGFGFRYPTIFQGWQTFVGAVLFLCMQRFGKIELELTSLTRQALLPWLPYLLIYVLSIYTGSVALSNMPVPVFICLHNVASVLNLMADRIVFKAKVLTPKEYLTCSFILVSNLFVSSANEESSRIVYFWMILHITTSVMLVNYTKMFINIPRIGDLTLLFLCYIFSVITLLPATILLGDLSASAAFPFWRHQWFYCGCVVSGVSGALLTVHWCVIKDRAQLLCACPVALSGLGKLSAACISFYVFPPKSQPTYANLFWIFINCISAVALCDVYPQGDVITRTMKPSLSDPDINPTNKQLSQQV